MNYEVSEPWYDTMLIKEIKKTCKVTYFALSKKVGHHCSFNCIIQIAIIENNQRTFTTQF